MQSVGTVKTGIQISDNDILQQGDGHFFRMHEEGIVIKRKVLNPQSFPPMGDFVNYQPRSPAPELPVEYPRGTVWTAAGAASGGEDGKLIDMRKKIPGRIGKGIQIIRIRSIGRRNPQDSLEN